MRAEGRRGRGGMRSKRLILKGTIVSGQDQKFELFAQFFTKFANREQLRLHLESINKSHVAAKLQDMRRVDMLSPSDRDELFKEFSKWQESAGRRVASSAATGGLATQDRSIAFERNVESTREAFLRFTRTTPRYKSLYESFVRSKDTIGGIGHVQYAQVLSSAWHEFSSTVLKAPVSTNLLTQVVSQFAPAPRSFVPLERQLDLLTTWLYQEKTKGLLTRSDPASIQTYVRNNYRGQYDEQIFHSAVREVFASGVPSQPNQQHVKMDVASPNQDPRSPAQIEYEKRLITNRNRRAITLSDRDETKKRSYFADPGGVLLPAWISHTFPENERDPNSKRIRAGGKPLRDLPDSYVIKYLVNKEFRDPHLNAAIADYVASLGPAFAAKLTHAYEDRGGLSPADSDKYRSDYKPGSSSAWAKFDREERGFAVSDRDPTPDDYRQGRGSHYKFRRGEQRYPKTYDPEGWFSRDVAELNKMVFGYANAVQFDSITGRYIAQYKSVNEGRGDPRRMGEWSTVRDPASAGGNLRQTFTPKQGIDREMMEGGLMIEHRPMSMKFKGRFRAATNAIFGPGFYEEVFSRDQGKIPWNPEKTKTNPISGEDVMGDAKSYRPKYMYLQRLLRGVRNEEWGRSTEYEDTIQSMQEVIWSERFNRDEKRLMGNREEMEPSWLVEQGGVAARGNHPDVREESRTPGNEWIVDQGAGKLGKLMGDPDVKQPIQEDWVLSLSSIQKAGSHQELDHYVGLIEQTYGSIREVQPLLEAASQRRSLLSVASK